MGTINLEDYPHATLDSNAANIDDIKDLDSKIKKNAGMIDNITEFIIPGLQQDLGGHINRVDNITDRRLNTLEHQCAKLEEEVSKLKGYLFRTAMLVLVEGSIILIMAIMI